MNTLIKTAREIRTSYVELSNARPHEKTAIIQSISRGLGTFSQKGVPLLSDYAANMKNLLIDPVRKKGLGHGLWNYSKRILTPTSYKGGLMNKYKGYRTQVKQLQTALKAETDPAKIQKLQEQLHSVSQNAKQTQSQIGDIRQAGGALGYMGSQAKNIFAPGATMGDRANSAWNLTKATGHHAGEGLNLGFVYGAPAYGMYEAYTAPEGQRFGTLGRVLGENAGFLGLGPVGAIPGIAASMAGSHLGRKALGSFDRTPSMPGLGAVDNGMGIAPNPQMYPPMA